MGIPDFPDFKKGCITGVVSGKESADSSRYHLLYIVHYCCSKTGVGFLKKLK